MTEITEFALIAPVAENIVSPPPENAPELPKTIPLASANAADGAKGGIIEKIRGIGDRAYQKTVEIVKRGRGRPPKNGQPKANDTVRETQTAIPGVPLSDNSPSVEAGYSGGGSIFDGDLIKTCVSAIAKGVCAFFKSKIEDAALAKGASSGQAERLANKCDVTPDEIDSLGQFAGILLKKYNVDTQYAPEFAFGAIVAGIGLRFVAVTAEIKRIPSTHKE